MAMHTLAIFGITGRTGRELARAASAGGWTVRGFARPDGAVPAGIDPVGIVRGDFAAPNRVLEAVTGAEAVCCVIGPRPPFREAFCEPATKAILRAMQQAGVRRLVCQTGAMVGTGNRTFAFECLARLFARRHPAVAQDRLEQERAVAESGLDWTLVKPPRLTEGPSLRRVIAGPALRVGLFSKIRRADVAAFMLASIETAQHLRARVFVVG